MSKGDDDFIGGTITILVVVFIVGGALFWPLAIGWPTWTEIVWGSFLLVMLVLLIRRLVTVRRARRLK